MSAFACEATVPFPLNETVRTSDATEALSWFNTSVVADAAYDTVAVYDAANERGAEVVIPPPRTAVASRRRPRSAARDRTIRRVAEIGRRQWKKESGYHRQGTVDKALFRYETVIASSLRARHADAQKTEAPIACSVLNRMLGLGRPESITVRP